MIFVGKRFLPCSKKETCYSSDTMVAFDTETQGNMISDKKQARMFYLAGLFFC